MITLDVTKYGKKLTLNKLSELYDDINNIMSPIPVQIGVKAQIQVSPDLLLVTKQQLEKVFGWDNYESEHNWRGIPIHIIDLRIEDE